MNTKYTAQGSGRGVSRRGFLGHVLAAGAAGAAWTKAFRITPSLAADGCAPPEGFPASIELYRQAFENWAREIKADDVWTAVPRSPEDVVLLANWAAENGYRIRARGAAHSWSPVTLAGGEGCAARVVLVETTELAGMEMVAGSPAAVRVEAGATMEELLTFLEGRGAGLAAVPAVGNITVGGALAVGAHGAGVAARGEVLPAGQSFGSLSNLVVSLTAVVWDENEGRYVLRTFDRKKWQAAALATHVGRGFLTEVTLRVGQNQRLRCVSHVDIPASELFARPEAGASRTLSSLLDASGRVEIVWYPFTDKPWTKVWGVSPQKPLASREVNQPYNYPFGDTPPQELVDLGAELITGCPDSAPLFGQMQYNATVVGLAATQSQDIWGWSKNIMLNLRPETMRFTQSGHAVVTSRANVQRVVAEFREFYEQLLEAYEAEGLYPVNGGVYLRVSGVDRPEDSGVKDAQPPRISATRPSEDHPDWDCVVWLNVLTLTGTPHAGEFLRDLEAWIFSKFSGGYAAARPEWSKGYAYTDQGGWRDREVLGDVVPAAHGAHWERARADLNELDPYRIYTNDFLDVLLP